MTDSEKESVSPEQFEEFLGQATHEKGDVYKIAAEYLYKVPYDRVTPKMKAQAQARCFYASYTRTSGYEDAVRLASIQMETPEPVLHEANVGGDLVAALSALGISFDSIANSVASEVVKAQHKKIEDLMLYGNSSVEYNPMPTIGTSAIFWGSITATLTGDYPTAPMVILPKKDSPESYKKASKVIGKKGPPIQPKDPPKIMGSLLKGIK